MKADIDNKISDDVRRDIDEPVVYDGLEFKSRAELDVFLHEDRAYRFFPWIFLLPEVASLLITACAFGAIGGVTRVAGDVALQRNQLGGGAAWTMPVFGALMGIMILGLSYVVPTALIREEANLRPTTLLFLCLFGGVFCESFYDSLKARIGSVFFRERGGKPRATARKAEP